jgi:hypothetical protein
MVQPSLATLFSYIEWENKRGKGWLGVTFLPSVLSTRRKKEKRAWAWAEIEPSLPGIFDAITDLERQRQNIM